VKQATPLPPASVVQPLKVESVKSEAKPELSTSSTKSPDSIPLINPNAGDLYLQLGAMNAEATRRFVQDLHSKNLEPHVAAGPTPGIMRVLLGPFNDRAALDEQKAQLEAQGLSTFVRRY
jgi:cell division septation protein DedD